MPVGAARGVRSDGFITPMLASTGPMPRSDGWSAEVKWDGVRLVGRSAGGRLQLWARSGIDRTAAWPEFGPLVDALDGREFVVDGEAVVIGPDGRPRFDLVQRRMHTSERSAGVRLAIDLPAVLMIFDLLELDGEELFDRPWSERRQLLDSLIPDGASWRASPCHDDPDALLAAIAERGMEGIVAKRHDARYQPGRRTDAWVKIKSVTVDEFVVGGWFEGSGSRSATFGSLAIGIPIEDGSTGLRYVGSVGSGFDQLLLSRLRSVLDELARTDSPFVEGQPPAGLRPVEPMITVRVRYGEWTPDGVLRHPVMLGLAPSTSQRGGDDH